MSKNDKEIFYARLTELTNRACDVIDTIFDNLSITYYKGHNYICGPCPVHQGDNKQAWVFYPYGHTRRGLWHCYSKGCHEKYGKYLIQLIQGILEVQSGEEVFFKDATLWLANQLGFDKLENVPLPDKFILDRRSQYTRDYYFNKKAKLYSNKISRWQARDKIRIPSEYYLRRGYPKEVLDKYDVGDTKDRVVVPVYDIDYKVVLGSTSRSVHNQCKQCRLWHDPKSNCPRKDDFKAIISSSKWYNNNFEKSESLYNLWHQETKDTISKRGKVILVEGPGDVWRLEEADIHNSVAIYGLELSYYQISLLFEYYVTEVALLVDPDRAGKHAIKILTDKLKREFNVRTSNISDNDVGDMNIREIPKIILTDLKGKNPVKLKEFV